MEGEWVMYTLMKIKVIHNWLVSLLLERKIFLCHEVREKFLLTLDGMLSFTLYPLHFY